MKIVITYKQTWVEEQELTHNLTFIRKILENLWHETFIYFLDDNSDKTATYITQKVKEEIEKANVVLCFINHKEKSEGMLLELWEAFALWKEIILLINSKYRGEYYLTHSIAKYTQYFDEVEDTEQWLKALFTPKENKLYISKK